jgi:hypothetical protein
MKATICDPSTKKAERGDYGQPRSRVPAVLVFDEGERDAEPLTAPADVSVSSL